MRNKKRPFALAAVWDSWKRKPEDPAVYGFAVLTMLAYGIFYQIGFTRMPLIISESKYKTWLKSDTPLNSITSMLHPFSEEYLNAYPIKSDIINSIENKKELITSACKFLVKEEKKIVEEKKAMKMIIMDSIEKCDGNNSLSRNYSLIKNKN
jgi:putative SOS response-associated peptidase YedK